MNMHIHHLTGCAPDPLAHYLKALGILRLVAEQVDSQVRGWWQDEHFCLLTKLDRDALERFFLEQYAPTPFVSPWNGGSGFYPKDNKIGFNAVQESSAARFATYRNGIERGESVCAALTSKPDKKQKPILLSECFKAWRHELRDWLNAAIILTGTGDVLYPSLLGTGGNDGRLDFTNNAMQQLGELFDLADLNGKPCDETPSRLKQAFWSDPTNHLTMPPIGQFLPSGAGGANSTTAADGKPLVNPWDFILMLEGAILFTTRATRRMGSQSTARASAPFVMYAHEVGYLSPGTEKNQRGEQWMPVWSRPSTLSELSAMLGEARLQVGRRTAEHPVDAARAVARLGVARGIDAFVRYGYLERNGQNTFAVSLGRIVVQPRPHAHLIDDIAHWMDRLHRIARKSKNYTPPNRFVHAERRLANAVFAVLTHDETAEWWQAVLRAAVAVEAIQVGGTAVQAGPIPRLDPQWLSVADDGGPENAAGGRVGQRCTVLLPAGRPSPPNRHGTPSLVAFGEGSTSFSDQ